MIVDELIQKGNSQAQPLITIDGIKSRKKIAIYGIGQGFLTFKTFVIDKFDLDICLYIDKCLKSNDEFNGKPSANPNDLNSIDVSDHILIITNSYSDFPAIKKNLAKIKFDIIYSAFDFYEYHVAYAPKEMISAGTNYYISKKKQIQEAFNLLWDADSKSLFFQILDLYINRNKKLIVHESLNKQYLPSDAISIDYSNFINCGAFNGDTIENIFEMKGKFQTIIAIEPDLKNFQELNRYLEKNGANIAHNIYSLPLALGKETSNSKFSSSGSNSHLSNNGENSLLCVSLDDIALKSNVSFINMDIEGAELYALQGSKNLLQRNRPCLAISIYHMPNHLWDIILFLESLNIGYRFSIKNYTGFPAETVLYAFHQD